MRRTTKLAAVAALPVVGLGVVISGAADAASAPHLTGSVSLSGPAQYATFNNIGGTQSASTGSFSYTNFEQADTAATGVWSLPLHSPVHLGFDLGDQTYAHNLTVDSIKPTSLTSFTFTGDGTYDPDTSYTWTATGSVSGTTVQMHVVYTGTNAGYTVDLTGTIGTDGSVTGSATDSNGQTLILTMPAGSLFQALDYTAPVSGVSFTGTTASFNSAIPAGHVYPGTGFKITVRDGGSPGAGNDFYQQDGSDYPITSGNLVVH